MVAAAAQRRVREARLVRRRRRRCPPNRKRWTTVLGSFHYPCWLDRRRAAASCSRWPGPIRFEGPAVIYPDQPRARTTPLDQFTVVDVVRATLGVGPCEYILDVEGQGADDARAARPAPPATR